MQVLLEQNRIAGFYIPGQSARSVALCLEKKLQRLASSLEFALYIDLVELYVGFEQQ